MSFVVTVSTSTVSYALPNGATNAFAGQTIASATWNNIHTDIQANGMAVLGSSPNLTLKGNLTGATAVVTDISVPAIRFMTGQATAYVTLVVSFSLANTDNAMGVPLPSAITTYRVEALSLSQPSANLNTATVALYSGAGATGVAIVGPSVAVTVSTTSANTNNNCQFFAVNNQSTQDYNAAVVYFRVGANTASGTGTVTLYIRPVS